MVKGKICSSCLGLGVFTGNYDELHFESKAPMCPRCGGSGVTYDKPTSIKPPSILFPKDSHGSNHNEVIANP